MGEGNIYCLSCKHYESGEMFDRAGTDFEYCTPPIMEKKETKDDYLSPSQLIKKKVRQKPRELNKNNDCGYFEQKITPKLRAMIKEFLCDVKCDFLR